MAVGLPRRASASGAADGRGVHAGAGFIPMPAAKRPSRSVRCRVAWAGAAGMFPAF